MWQVHVNPRSLLSSCSAAGAGSCPILEFYPSQTPSADLLVQGGVEALGAEEEDAVPEEGPADGGNRRSIEITVQIERIANINALRRQSPHSLRELPVSRAGTPKLAAWRIVCNCCEPRTRRPAD
jgi:hypothetical protein